MYAHPNTGHWGFFSLGKLVREVAASLRPRLQAQAIAVDIDIPSGDGVVGDRALLRRAILNLMLNAIDAMPHGGSLVATSADGPNAVELEIADSGDAVSDDRRRQAFNAPPFSQRSSISFALAVVRRVAEVHGGSLSVVNCPDGGVAFTLTIPRPIALEAAA